MKRTYIASTKTVSIHLNKLLKTRDMKKICRKAIRECPETVKNVRIMVKCGREYRKVFTF